MAFFDKFLLSRNRSFDSGFFAPVAHADLLREVRSELERRGMSWRQRGDCLEVRRAGQRWLVGLPLLARECRGTSGSARRTVIADHLNEVLRSSGGERALGLVVRSWRSAEARLRTQLCPAKSENAERSELISQRVAPGLDALLVCDVDGDSAPVRRADARRWGLSPAELMRVGLDNLREREPEIPEELDLENGTGVRAARSSRYSAARALLAEVPAAPHGAIVAVPTRHAALWHEVRGSTAESAARAMLPIVRELHREGPDPLTDNLYWLCDGSARELPMHGSRVELDRELRDRIERPS